MLTLMNRNGAFLGDACADPIGSLDLLGPNTAEPYSPILELLGFRRIATMIDYNAAAVAKQDDVVRPPHDVVEAVELVLGIGNQLFQRLAKVLELAARQYSRRLARCGIDAVSVHAALPGYR